MKAAFKKVYTLIPLIVVVFFFQNCSNKRDSHASIEHANYEGFSNIKRSKMDK